MSTIFWPQNFAAKSKSKVRTNQLSRLDQLLEMDKHSENSNHYLIHWSNHSHCMGYPGKLYLNTFLEWLVVLELCWLIQWKLLLIPWLVTSLLLLRLLNSFLIDQMLYSVLLTLANILSPSLLSFSLRFLLMTGLKVENSILKTWFKYVFKHKDSIVMLKYFNSSWHISYFDTLNYYNKNMIHVNVTPILHTQTKFFKITFILLPQGVDITAWSRKLS